MNPSVNAYAAISDLFRHSGLRTAVLRDVRRRMRAPGRHYHNVEHLVDLWRLHRRLAVQSRFCVRPADRMIARALMFHDAICDPRRSDNEAASAALWRRHASIDRGTPRGEITRVAAVIEATGRHAAGPARGIRDDPVMRWVLDLDLASIGAPSHRFQRNTSRLRAEFLFLSAAEWDRQRIAFLRSLAARPGIYHSRSVAAGFEATARANIAREFRAAGLSH